MKARLLAVLFIAFLVLLSVVWGRTAKAIEHPYSIQNPGLEPPVNTSEKGTPDAPLCGPSEPPENCLWPWYAHPHFQIGLSSLVILSLAPFHGWKKEADAERSERAENLRKDRAEETPELVPATLIEIPSPINQMRRKSDAA